jgi:hypothetical protein
MSLVRAPYSYTDSLEISSANPLDSIPTPQGIVSKPVGYAVLLRILHIETCLEAGWKTTCQPLRHQRYTKGMKGSRVYTSYRVLEVCSRKDVSSMAISHRFTSAFPMSASLLARHHWVIAISCRLFLWLICYVYRNSSWSLKPMRVRWSRSGLLLLGVRYM